MGRIPLKADREFVAAMEDVPGVYQRPYGAGRPVVCVDEMGKQLTGEVRPPPAARPGDVGRDDREHVRDGTADLFIAFERSGNRRPPRDPPAGRRHVEVTDTRTRTDFARFVRGPVDGRYKDAGRIVLVTGRSSTHSVAPLCQAFTPAEAGRIAGRLEIHHTPEHGSRPDMAGIEPSVPARQRLDRRIEDKHTLVREAAAWEAPRNSKAVKAGWQFRAADARTEPRKLYPTIDG